MFMIGVILAAGKGTRLGLDIPKAMVEVAGKPLISYVIDGMRKAEVSKIIVVVKHQEEIIRDYLSPEIQCVRQGADYGTAAALRAAMPYVTESMVLAAFGDVLVYPDSIYRQVANGFQSEHGAIAIDPIGPTVKERKGIVRLRPNTQVWRIDEQLPHPGKMNNTGIFAFWKGILYEGLNAVKRNRAGEYTLTSAINYIAMRGRINTVVYDGTIFDIGTPDKLAEAEAFMEAL